METTDLEKNHKSFERKLAEKLDRFNGELSESLSEGYRHFTSAAGNNDGSGESKNGRKGRHRQDLLAELSQLAQFMQNPIYAALHERVSGLLQTYRSVTEAALEEARAAVDSTGVALDTLTDQANRLPDGRMVFADAHGNVFDADGQPITEAERESLVLRPGAPSWEQYQAAKQDHEQAQADLQALEAYEARLGQYADRLESEDDPPSPEELEQMEQDIQRFAPDGVRTQIEIQPTETVSAPDLLAKPVI